MNIQYMFDMKREFHDRNARIPFEEKVRQIIELQKIDMEFNKQRKSPRAPYMRVWKMEEGSGR
ncbi:MAG: hypothetical protein HYV29_15275 [Ignavibacteriales bacterium]|nr:hypothetical protein [Ignavibacteriales bacterium]